MAQEINELIAKIQREGVKAAEEQAAQLREQALAEAKKISEAARLEAKKITDQAVFEAKKTRESTEASLRQAGRDLLINLKKEIQAMLERLVKADMRGNFSAEETEKIIAELIKNTPLAPGAEVVISLNPDDKKKLEKVFFARLAAETKKKINLKSADEIACGFMISFDSGSSSFDFSDKAMAEYICGCLKPELDKILKG